MFKKICRTFYGLDVGNEGKSELRDDAQALTWVD